MIKQEAILVNKRGGQCKIESSCLFACEEFVLDNFKEKESLDFTLTKWDTIFSLS